MYQKEYLESQHLDRRLINSIRDKHLKVLIVDDQDRFRAAMTFSLEIKYGVEVKDVGSGMEAIETLQAGDRFDIVLLDIVMPEVNGIETYKLLREIDDECKVVMMSAYSDSDEWEEAGRLEVEMLPKPIPWDMLTRIMFDIANR